MVHQGSDFLKAPPPMRRATCRHADHTRNDTDDSPHQAGVLRRATDQEDNEPAPGPPLLNGDCAPRIHEDRAKGGRSTTRSSARPINLFSSPFLLVDRGRPFAGMHHCTGDLIPGENGY